jgi:DNA-binding transcriptional MerR regulator
MDAIVAIGDFSKMTYLSVKALRHYHDIGLLEPAVIDPETGYRRYATSQVNVAQAIRRFRDLGMPLDDIRRVLEAPGPAVGNRVILAHLERMQHQLEETQATVASLQALLGEKLHDAPVTIQRLAATRVLTTHAVVDFDDCGAWLEPALADLHAAADVAGLRESGCDGAIYSDEFFEEARGNVIAFVPVDGDAEGIAELPAITVAQLVHDGPFTDLDKAYGALGAIVTERGIGGSGPIREHYLTSTRTEVCWPVTAAM